MSYADNIVTVPDVSGTVLRVEKSSIHDGEGLRTVIFLKGCPLRCIWCSTPESQHSNIEIGYIKNKCIGCGLCTTACRHGARALDKSGKIIFSREKCVGCLDCLSVCVYSAIVHYGDITNAVDVVKEIEKDELFYFHSGGGVTISGGEPLEQPEFVLSILRKCSYLGISCALETSLFAAWEKIEPLLQYLNIIYVDIKHPDSNRHKSLTGRENRLIIDNILRLDKSKYNFHLIVRTPLIPGINDGEENMEKLAGIVNGLGKLKCVELLTYHRLGVETYAKLGRNYILQELQSLNIEEMKSSGLVLKKLVSVPVMINGVLIN